MAIYKRDYRRNKEGHLTRKEAEGKERKSTGTRKAGSKTRSMGAGQKGTSGYLKSKKKTLRELDAATGETNELDQVQSVMDREDEDSKGITQHIRNIFKQ